MAGIGTVHGADDAEVIRNVANVREDLTDMSTALAMLLEAER